MAGGGRAGFRLTHRDLEIARWIGRLRFAEARQVARRFGMDERNAYRRLAGLVSLSLLEHRRVFHGVPGIYMATHRGLEAAGLRLPTPRLDVRTYAHELAAATLLIDLEHEFGKAAVLTERELRHRDSGVPAEPRYGVFLGAQRTRRGLHFPDLAVERIEERPLAIELELTAKGRTRLEAIVSAYVRARQIASVRYYLAPAARKGVERAVERLSAHDLFDLRDWREPHGSGTRAAA